MSINGGKWRILTWLTLGVGTAVAAAVSWVTGHRSWADVLAAGGVALALVAYLADRRDAQAADIDMAMVADRLDGQVKGEWAAEANRREITELPVSWRPVSSSLVQPWSYLEHLVKGGAGWTIPAHRAAGPDELAGTRGELIDVFERVPTGRLVVLGEPGSGKTALLIRLVLDLLARRGSKDPVPLLVPLASWNPDQQDLYSWLDTQIVRQYPWLAGTEASGVSRAWALLDAGLILPVLDGLDEIRSGRRYRALIAINAALRNDTKVVLSCRAKAFRHAIRPGPTRQPVFLEGAAGIRLASLPPAAVAEYLTANAGPDGQDRWATVCAALTTTPTSPVTQALSTPLMASLARAIYNPRPGDSNLGLPNPADLCIGNVFPTRTAVEEHLFDGLIHAAYRPHPSRTLRGRWTVTHAERYLIFLARHLDHRVGTTSLAWWEIASAVPWVVRILAVGLASGLIFGLAAGLMSGLMFGFYIGLRLGLAFGLAVGLVEGLEEGLNHPAVRRIVVRFASPRIASGFASAIGAVTNPPPRQIVARRPGTYQAGYAFGLCVMVLVLCLGLGLLVGLVFWPLGFTFLLKALVAGLLVGLAAGLAAGLRAIITANTADATHRATDPRSLLAQDRYCAAADLLFGIIFGPLVGLAMVILVGIHLGLVFGLVLGIVLGLQAGVASASGRFAVTCLFLVSWNRLPIRLMEFLSDAAERGVLRYAGAVWEFRHPNLQRRLANRP